MAFAWMTLSIAVWLVGDAILFSIDDHALALIVARVPIHLGVAFIPSFAWIFTLEVTGQRQRWNRTVPAVLLASLAFFAVSAGTDWWARDIREFFWGHYVQYGSAGYAFIGYFALLMTGALLMLSAESRRATRPTARLRLRRLRGAYVVACLACVDFLPALGIGLYPYGYVLIMAFMGIAAVAIWRSRLSKATPEFAAAQMVAIMSDGLVVVDEDGNACLVNQAAERILGKPASELLGRPLPPGLPRPDGVGRDVIYRPPDSDQHLLLQISRSSILDGANGEIASVWVIDDVTAERTAENALRARNQELREALETVQRANESAVQQERLRVLGQMASGIVHDFNNALTPILGFSELLVMRARRLGLDEQKVQRLDTIHTAAEDASAMIRRLRMLYRRDDNGHLREAVDLNEIVRESVELTRPVWHDQAAARGRAVTIEPRLAEPLPPVSGNPSDLREALVLLAGAAILVATLPNPNWTVMASVLGPLAVLAPVAFFPLGKTIRLAVDIAMRSGDYRREPEPGAH
ncbi:MAG: PAS domain S-box protein [SAR202 cluster bacterium]|nr:PAS domain S-box protein [SAR202 cluster bacterium]